MQADQATKVNEAEEKEKAEQTVVVSEVQFEQEVPSHVAHL